MLYRGRGVNEGEVINRLTAALEAARNAVAADSTGDYSTAYQKYKAAIDIFESEISNIPEEHQSELLRKTQGYQSRVNLMEENVPTLKRVIPGASVASAFPSTAATSRAPSAKPAETTPSTALSTPEGETKNAYIAAAVARSTDVGSAPSTAAAGAPTASPSSSGPGTIFFKKMFSKEKGEALVFKEEIIPEDGHLGLGLAPPVEPSKRPYWLIKMLTTTMTTGGFLAPSVYIPTDVWFQSGVKFVAVKEKVNAFELLLGGLQKMQQTGLANAGSSVAVLQEVVSNLDDIRTTLAKTLKYIDDGAAAASGGGLAKLTAGLRKGLGGASKTDEGYIELVCEVFQTIGELEPWVDGLGSEPAMLKFVLFLQSVVLAIVVRDFGMLLDRYIAKVKENWME